LDITLTKERVFPNGTRNYTVSIGRGIRHFWWRTWFDRISVFICLARELKLANFVHLSQKFGSDFEGFGLLRGHEMFDIAKEDVQPSWD
jgi:hypothetical protein